MLLPWPTVYPPPCTQCDRAACQETDGQMLMESEVDAVSANLKMLEIQWRVGTTRVISANDPLPRCGPHGRWRQRSSSVPVSLRKCSAVLFIKLTNPIVACARALPPQACGCVWVGHHLLPIRRALCSQTCPLTVDREVLNELKLDKNCPYRHGNTNHSSYSWHPLDFSEQREQKCAPLNLPH